MVANERTYLDTDIAYITRLQLAVEDAAVEQQPYTILACVPQALPGEVTSDIVQVVAECVHSLLRDEDISGLIEGNIVVVGLPETNASGARVLAYRLQSDLTLRSTPLRNTSWDAGFACLPDQGLTADELMQTAIDLARTRRRRLAE